MADSFDDMRERKGKRSIREYPSAMIKLLKECNKLKEILSANKESRFFVENLLDNIDFK